MIIAADLIDENAGGVMERLVPFISRVRLENYKSIESCDVGLSPLTVLVGPNGSGKSNFLDALSFVARALDTNLTTAIDERGGLPELLRRVPYATDSFSIEVDVATLWGSLPVTGSYGLTIGRDRGTSFEVVREDCDLRWSGNRGGWRRRGSSVRGEAGSRVALMEPDRLYLPVAGSQLPVGELPGGSATTVPTPFSELSRGLRDMRFYSLGLDELRQPKPASAGALLGYHGEHLADVVGALAREHRDFKERLDAYLAAVLGSEEADGARIEQWFSGPLDERGYTSVQLRSRAGVADREAVFGPLSMSDGTVRAAGVLAALFQPAVLDGRIPLVGIEEPEAALHPAAAGALFDALTEASQRVQVVATSQSADLLDREDLDLASVRSVTMEQGLTVIGNVDSASREIVDKGLHTLGELMRGNQVTPEPAPSEPHHRVEGVG
jgi:predicted ATPase